MRDVVTAHPETLYLILGETHPVVRRHEGEVVPRIARETRRRIRPARQRAARRPLSRLRRTRQLSRRRPTSTSRRTSTRCRSSAARWRTPSAAARRSSRRRTSTREELLAHDRGFLCSSATRRRSRQTVNALLDDPRLRREHRAPRVSLRPADDVAARRAEYGALFASLLPLRLPRTGDVGLARCRARAAGPRPSGRDDRRHRHLPARAFRRPEPVVRLLHRRRRARVHRRARSDARPRDRTIGASARRRPTSRSCTTRSCADGWFHNFMGYDRRWLDERGTHDCCGRAIWALGYGVARAPRDAWRRVCARACSMRALPHSPVSRTCARAPMRALGLIAVALAEPGDARYRARRCARPSRRSAAAYRAKRHAASGAGSKTTMTYDNGRLLRGPDSRRDRARRSRAPARPGLEMLAFYDGDRRRRWHVRADRQRRLVSARRRARSLRPAAARSGGDGRRPSSRRSTRPATRATGHSPASRGDWYFGRNTHGFLMVTNGGCCDGHRCRAA